MKTTVMTLVLLCGMITSSVAHEWWGNGTEVDPKTKMNCCGKSDCKFIDEKTLIRRVGPQGIYLKFPNPMTEEEWNKTFSSSTKRPAFIESIIPHVRVQPSPDGKYWACINSWGDILCYFEPHNGA